MGANKNIFPNIEEYVTMRPGSKIIGKCRINSNCDIGLNAVVLDKNIKSNSIYLGDPNNFKIITNKKKISGFNLINSFKKDLELFR